MVAIGLCVMCREPSNSIISILGRTEPVHCYGKGDRPALPGVMGGFHCTCPCRDWPKP